MAQTASDRINLNPPTALLILEDGSVFEGIGFGAEETRVGEICFNTSITGYQEIMTDPSYAGQIITFTFPHIGNTGINSIDVETATPSALGMITREIPTEPSNYRAFGDLSTWLAEHSIPGIASVDTRALTHRIRNEGAPKGVLAVNLEGRFDRDELLKMAQDWSGLAGMELASDVSRPKAEHWTQSKWMMADDSYGDSSDGANRPDIVALDYGCKHNILRCLTDAGFNVHVMPATTSAEAILAMNPSGVFLSNGPGDPAATAEYAAGTIRILADSGLPIFGICIGHQLIAEAFGAKTYKMQRGHRGANHPVKDLTTGKIEITSQNHGFAVDSDGLPPELEITHISLFDGSVEGLKHKSLPVFSVQYHPEASPGPHDAQHLFGRFIDLVKANKVKSTKNKRGRHATS